MDKTVNFSIFRSIFILCFFHIGSSSLHGAHYVAVVSHFKSGKILAQKEGNKPVYPASLTKLMTLYLAFEALTQKTVSLSTRITISLNAAKQPPCKWGVKVKESLSLRQCIAILATRSANDIAVAMAENLASSQEHFVQRMNAKAKKLGMRHTFFYNPSGWHHPLQKTTAKDIAILLRAICIHFPKYRHFLAIPFIQKGPIRVANTNKLLGRVPGVQLGKTGFTCPAGWNLATLTQRETGGIITVVMGMSTGKARDQHTTHLIETFYKNPRQLHTAIAEPTHDTCSRIIPVNMASNGLSKFLKKSKNKQILASVSTPKSIQKYGSFTSVKPNDSIKILEKNKAHKKISKSILPHTAKTKKSIRMALANEKVKNFLRFCPKNLKSMKKNNKKRRNIALYLRMPFHQWG